jgi:hypothetical protein
MKLIGNSVSVPVIKMLCQAILDTGVFGLRPMGVDNSQAPADIIMMMPPSKADGKTMPKVASL